MAQIGNSQMAGIEKKTKWISLHVNTSATHFERLQSLRRCEIQVFSLSLQGHRTSMEYLCVLISP